MESLGEFLKQGRVKKGFSLEDLAGLTRIRIENLDSLEREDLEALPTDPYVRGFVKLVCRELDLEPADGLLRYETLRRDSGPPDEMTWAEERTESEPGFLEEALQDPERVLRVARRIGIATGGALALGLLVTVIVLGVRGLASREKPVEVAAVAATATGAAAEPSDSQTPDPMPTGNPEGSAQDPLPATSLDPQEGETGDDGARGDEAAAQALREQAAREEAARLEREREEAARLEREREEAARLEREREEAARLEREREEAARLERERQEAARLERERQEATAAATGTVATAPSGGAIARDRPDQITVALPSRPEGERLVLRIEAARRVQVSVLLDGVGHPRVRTLEAGAAKTWKADELFVIGADDGGALRLTLSDVEIGMAGSDGVPLEGLRIRAR